jgi:hypothetical protein
MKPETYQLFAQLCESIALEASSSMGLIKSLPGGSQVVQLLHKSKGLAHDQEYSQTPKIAWSELKNMSRGGWVLLKYPKGVGAIKQTNGSYEAVASTGGEPVTFRNDRGGNILDFLKGELGGNPKSMFIGRDSGAVGQTRRSRQERDSELTRATELSPESIMKKFKPLWAKAINAAIADIKGMIATQIKNDAFDKAEKKLKQVTALRNGLEDLDSGSTDTPSFVKNALNQALALTAGHYYPDQAGELTRSSYGSYGSRADEAIRLVLKDISGGDQNKLGTVLAFFKRSLISG